MLEHLYFQTTKCKSCKHLKFSLQHNIYSHMFSHMVNKMTVSC
jgi:hypothetical protein